MSNEKAITTSRYEELDALRGLAALLVVFFHLTMRSEQSKLGFHLGVTGVNLFFIISGFVIFMSLNNISTTKEFAINRVTRLYPTYWTCVSITFLLHIIVCQTFNPAEAVPFADYLANLTMFQFYFGVQDIDGPYWTMIVEMLFYIFIGMVFSLRQLKHIIPIGSLLIFLIAIADLVYDTPAWQLYSEFRRIVPMLNYFPLFFAGIIFYKIRTETKNHFLYYALLLFLFAIYSWKTDSTAFVSRTELILMTALYFLLFILFVSNKLRFIVSAPSLFLGKISFALYLIHQYLSTQIVLPFLLERFHFNFWGAVFICLTTVILLAAIITYAIEIPAGKWMNDVLRKAFALPQRMSAIEPIIKSSALITLFVVSGIFVCLVGALYATGFLKANDQSFTLRTQNKEYLFVDVAHQNVLRANPDSAPSPEAFSLVLRKDSTCAIYTSANKYLTAELAQENEITASRDRISGWETFKMIKLEGNSVAFKAANGKYLSVDEGSLQLHAIADKIGENEKFEVIMK